MDTVTEVFAMIAFWTRRIKEIFIQEAMLDEKEIMLLESCIKGEKRTAQAAKFNISPETLQRRIKKLQQKYDWVQKEHSDVMPERLTEKWQKTDKKYYLSWKLHED